MNGNFLNEEEISKSIKKLELEINDEKLNFDDINTLLSALNVSYKTNNKTRLDELLFNLNTKLTTIILYLVLFLHIFLYDIKPPISNIFFITLIYFKSFVSIFIFSFWITPFIGVTLFIFFMEFKFDIYAVIYDKKALKNIIQTGNLYVIFILLSSQIVNISFRLEYSKGSPLTWRHIVFV